MTLYLKLLGPAQLNLGKEWVELPPGKTSALLYYLACKHDWVRRDELVYLLWPDSPESAARKNLRQLLSTIRRLPYAEGLEIEENRLRWNVTTDVQQFREAVAEGNIATATQLYQGELLQGYIVDIPEFEQWLNSERQALQASWHEAVLTFGSELEESGRYAETADLLARLRKVDPLDEDLLQRHVRNLALGGQRTKALEIFERFKQTLKQEYEGEPEEETLRLIERVKRGEALEPGAAVAEKTTAEEAKLRHNLPLQPTPFIGRAAEKARAIELLQDSTHRLLTLVGPGGIGKTRLAIEVASAQTEFFKDGAFFVNLAPITLPELVVTAIADAVGFAFYGATNPKEQLFTFLQDKEMLLVLDNFEQLLTAAPLVAELLALSPKIKILATSRAALRLYGEQEYAVPPLSLPDPEEIPSLERLSQYETVQLFIQRALAVKPDFQVTNENAPAVAEICHRLDGLALAIELAAARIRLFPPQALLSRLGSRLQTLTGGAQNLPSRQQTLRGAIDWSYHLLSAAEQKLFTRLAVFVGGCSFEAIETVCNHENDLGIDILEGVDSLVSKNLLRQGEVKGESRFMMLETIHEYAWEKLEESGEAESIKRAHAQFFAEFFRVLAERTVAPLSSPEGLMWLERVEADYGDLRAALRWADKHGEIDLSLRLGRVLWRLWSSRGPYREGREWLTTVLERETARTQTRAGVLFSISTLAQIQGDYSSARTYLKEALAVFNELGNDGGIAEVLNLLGVIAAEQGDYASAALFYEQGLVLARKLALNELIDRLLNNLGAAAAELGDYARARSVYEEGLAVAREMDNTVMISILLLNLGTVAYYQGDYSSARPLLMQGLETLKESGNKTYLPSTLEAFAALSAAEGEPERAARLYGGAEALRQAAGVPLPPSNRPRYKREVETARAQLDEESFRAAWVEGRAMGIEEVTVYALKR